MRTILHISLPLKLNKLFSYTLPIELDDKSYIGYRVLVPFVSKTLTGIVIGESKSKKTDGLKSIIEILDEKPFLNSKMVDFVNWISKYYFCSIGEVIKAILPSELEQKSSTKVKLIKEIGEYQLSQFQKKSPKRAALLLELSNHTDWVTLSFIEKKLNSKISTEELAILQEQNIIEVSDEVNDELKAKVKKAVKISNQYLDEEHFSTLLSNLEKKSVNHSKILAYLWENQENNYSIVELTEILGISRSSFNTLISKNILEIIEIEEYRNSYTEILKENRRDESVLKMTDEQKDALNKINIALVENTFKPFLLYGVTGSGKTLVFIHSILKVLEDGNTALLILPEIALTPQLMSRFNAVFGDKIAVIHSKLSANAKFDEYRKITNGDAKIVIGARSAIFAPLQNLKLIIVDEEHEQSYKQESPAPRYNARDAALYRAKLEEAVILLASATPSLESTFNAINNRYELLKINQRADGAELPKVQAIDMQSAKRNSQIKGSFSTTLIEKIIDRVQKKEGVILLQNRRGFANNLFCSDCGSSPKCTNCDVTLTYHKHNNRLVCHYCSYFENATLACKECGSADYHEIGTGTQKVEEELNEILASYDIKAIIQRMDLDTSSSIKKHSQIITKFANREIDILVGTQMVAKGLDFSHVSLVGVVNADLQLFMPDFRAYERTFQLISQVAGRAGRSGELKGEVLIQTYNPEIYPLKFAYNHDFWGFYQAEIKERITAHYPPITRFIKIEMQCEAKNHLDSSSKALYNLLNQKYDFMEVFPPNDALISKVKNYHRKIIIIKNIKDLDKSASKIRKFLDDRINKFMELPLASGIKLIIDIDSSNII